MSITVNDARRVIAEAGEKRIAATCLTARLAGAMAQSHRTSHAPPINARQAIGILDGYEIGQAVPISAQLCFDNGEAVEIEMLNRRIHEGY